MTDCIIVSRQQQGELHTAMTETTPGHYYLCHVEQCVTAAAVAANAAASAASLVVMKYS